MDNAVIRARQLLADVTPLRFDCGTRCQKACCAPDEDGQGGMLLFPGEEELYGKMPDGFRITDNPLGPLLICDGVCDRAIRPLSCMLFPLWIFVGRDGKSTVRMDRRGAAVCPLATGGLLSLNPDFVAAARRAGEILWQSDIQREFLIRTGKYILSLEKSLGG